MNIYLVRHGESQANLEKLFYGSLDSPLTEQGVEDAELAAKKLKDLPVQALYSSPLIRAYATAEYISAEMGLPIQSDQRLVEQHFGSFEGFTYEKLKEDHGSVFVDYYHGSWCEETPLGGESFADMVERIEPFLKEIIEKGEDCLIVSHNGVMRTLLYLILDLAPQHVHRMYFTQGDYCHFETDRGSFVIRAINK